MKRNLILLVAAGALGVILLSLVTDQPFLPGEPPVSTDSRDRAENSAAEHAQEMVARALAYLDEHGAAALAEKINADAPEFRDGEIYVFVLDHEGTIVAHPIYPDMVGMTAEQVKDPEGNIFITGLVEAATGDPDGGWAHYRWVNPMTGEAADKSSWVVMRDHHIVGSGIYGKPE